ncbi:hypothetical protein D9757_003040 [Collybiopsis confluens]|uniref:Uncharacterized protein n=1 Tax=Collybiopsis confluens TaxID=2823264 RepID=A0A8H5HXA0_9AGAR|nr:hypothetical protein D9757_003040 [Collybiopsis confluens]
MPHVSMASPATARSRPLKRSASMASLPTPPRTNRRAKHRKLRSLKAEIEEEEEEQQADETATSDDEHRPTGEANNKKRWISTVQEENEEEEAAFWLAGSSSSGKMKDKVEAKVEKSPAVDSDSDSESSTSFLLRLRQKSSTVGSAPVSPPPSRRRRSGAKIAPTLGILPAVEEKPSPAGTSPPETPKSSKMHAMRDSPENPFLASPLELDNAVSPSVVSTALPKLKEKPTMAFVLSQFTSTPEHPDYSPDFRGSPRVLWPAKNKISPALAPPDSPSNRAHRRKAGRPRLSLADSDDELDGKGEDDEEEVPLRPVRLFGSGNQRSSRS